MVKKREIKNLVIAILAVVVVSIVFMSFSNSKQNDSGLNTTSLGPAMTIYKDASCGCCSVYGTYMMREDYDVTIDQNTPVDNIKNQYTIPSNLRSCHTSLIEGYFVEGHIPEEVVTKLITEKPDIAGIAMPGMPSGSPGMPGTKRGDFVITAIGHDGSTYEFMRI